MATKKSFSLFDQLIEQLSELFESIDNATALVNEPSSISPAKAKSRLTYVTPLWDQCREIHGKLLRESDASLREKHPYFTEKQFSSKEKQYLDALDILQERSCFGTTATFESAATDGHTGSVDSSRRLVQVPSISLPKFSGSFEQWPPFHDYFDSLFIKDNSFDDMQRMHYLKACLEGEAAELIDNLNVTAANFSVAWDMLKSQYQCKRKLIWRFLEKLFSPVKITNESAIELRRLCCVTQSAVRTLSKFRSSSDPHEDFYLVFLTVSKLDKVTRKAWELSLGNNDEFPSFASLMTFLTNRIHALEALSHASKSTPANSSIQTSNSSTPKGNNPRSHHGAASSVKCPVCGKGGHNIYRCSEFFKSSVDKRFECIKKLSLCINCLSNKHIVSQCKSERNCRSCGKRHHTLLHRGDRSETITGNQTQAASPIATFTNSNTVSELSQTNATPSRALTHFSNSIRNTHVVLATAWVCVTGPSQRSAKIRVLLDQGSTHSLITSELSRALKLKTCTVNATLNGIGDIAAGKVSRVASITVGPLNANGPILSTDALVVPTLTSYVPHFKYPLSRWPHLQGLTLADPDPHSDAPIHMIVGADLYAYALLDGARRGSLGQPVAQNTIFGWIISGSTDDGNPVSHLSIHAHFLNANTSLDRSIRKFWEIEEVARPVPPSELDAQCEAHFRDTYSRAPDGKYIVRIPFICKPPLPIGQSLFRADKLLLSLERRLAKKPDERELYHDFMRDYEAREHMTRLLPSTAPNEQKLFLSHHPVLKMTSLTTKLRVVFNASAPTSNSKSINDLQHVGPKLQLDLPLLITRWRTHKYVYCADIQQMYRQILVHPDDRVYQLIRWRYNLDEPIATYSLNTVTFGMASAPFLALRVLQQLAEDEGHHFPLALPVVRAGFYVDDCLFGSDDTQLAIQTRNQVISLLQCGGFTLRKWASNSPDLLTGLPSEHHGLALDRTVQPDDTLKVLGLVWSPSSDSYKPSVQPLETSTITKREVLSTIARLYDPLGWVSPVVVQAKLFMQHLWQLKVNWDEALPDAERLQWLEFCQHLPQLNELVIPRWICQDADSIHCQLHGFSDASEKAYAGVVFSRIISCTGNIKVTLLMSKTRVAPLKHESIPRLELCAAALLSEMIASIITLPEYSRYEVHCWTDSTIVLAWLQKQSSHWKTFVGNRVALVHSILPQVRWKHVVSSDNPADLASRGICPANLISNSLWWKGPSWLSEPESCWTSLVPPVPEKEIPEMRVISMVADVHADPLQFAERFSSWTRLIRVIALILRWLPHRLDRVSTPVGVITGADIREATLTVARVLQAFQFPVELKQLKQGEALQRSSPLLNLNPFVDAQGLLRVGGRLQHSKLPDDAKHPIILRSHYVTRLLIEHTHRRCLHGGVSLTLNALRNKYWVLQAKKIIRSVIFHCVACTRVTAELSHQVMGPLPAPRILRPSRPFSHCGIDYAGPLAVRVFGGRGYRSHPAYIAVFVCFAVKAVHIEVVSDYSTKSFLAAFHRFCSRRGIPSDMYSDQGTNFQGADKELSQAFLEATQSEEFRARLANDSIIWHFNPPSAPHFGGLWESNVKSLKFHLKRILAAQTPTFEELCTLTAQIEACLNSRPLAPLTDTPESLDALTPGHFLIGGPINALPLPSVADITMNRLNRWQRMQQSLELFWRRWASDYVQALQVRSKWQLARNPIAIGQLVLLKSDNLPPTRWNLGRIIALHPGIDGLVRVVTVRTASTVLKRPVVKLALLPIRHESDAETPGITPTQVAHPSC